MKIKELLKYGSQLLNKNEIEDATLKTKMLLGYLLNIDKKDLIIYEEKEVTDEEEKTYKNHLKEILAGKPIQYIIHQQEFMRLTFYVDENVLIPQPDTEILVEETLKKIRTKISENKLMQETKELLHQEKKKTFRILDLCTGSGAIAISLSKYLENDINLKNQIKFEVYATDISEKALKVAKKNANYHRTSITFIQSNMFEKIDNFNFDVIVSNPPYIETEIIKTLSDEVKCEPYIALDGGKDGLDFYKIITEHGNQYLKKQGIILVEIGYQQKKSVMELFEKQQYLDIQCIKDLTGNDRVITAIAK